MQHYLDAYTASTLIGVNDRRIREMIEVGTLRSLKRTGKRGGGLSGESYLIELASLPVNAQILYLQSIGELNGKVTSEDLTAYKDRYGDDGMAELLRKQNAALAGQAIRLAGGPDMGAKLDALASENGVDRRSLERWIKSHQERGLAGIMRPIHRSDKGAPKGLCLFAQDYVRDQYLDEVKRSQQTVFTKLCAFAAEMGSGACDNCPYCDGTDIRAEIATPENPLPSCAEEIKQGLVIPAHRSTLNRFIAQMPAGVKAMGRRGVRYWEAHFMPKALRVKPERVNECWIGDHHEFDLFVLDERGRAVRPWVTAWMDAMSCMIVGWRISLNPNSTTIADSFVDGIAEKVDNPICGVPAVALTDNGKDYRSKRFEGAEQIEIELGKLNAGIDKAGLLQTLGVRLVKAIPYRAWSKPIENIFGILEDSWIRELPGWCGGSPDERPQEFHKTLRRLTERGELLTLDEFSAHFENVILPAYHARVQAGETMSPMEIYMNTPKARDDIPAYSVLMVIKEKSETRTVHPTGIKFKNAWYWHPNLSEHISKEVIIKYNDGDTESITVMRDGMFVAQAELKRRLKFYNEADDILSAHMREQGDVRKGTRAAIKQSREIVRRATASQFGPKVNTASKGTYTDINAEKRQRAKAEVDSKRAARGKDNTASDRVREKFLRDGKALGTLTK